MGVRKQLWHDTATREKIQTSQIINRLMAHFNGTVELSQTQVRSAEILLRKVLPDLALVEHTGEVEHSFVARIPEPAANATEWLASQAPKQLDLKAEPKKV